MASLSSNNNLYAWIPFQVVHLNRGCNESCKIELNSCLCSLKYRAKRGNYVIIKWTLYWILKYCYKSYIMNTKTRKCSICNVNPIVINIGVKLTFLAHRERVRERWNKIVRTWKDEFSVIENRTCLLTCLRSTLKHHQKRFRVKQYRIRLMKLEGTCIRH